MKSTRKRTQNVEKDVRMCAGHIINIDFMINSSLLYEYKVSNVHSRCVHIQMLILNSLCLLHYVAHNFLLHFF